jgi:hypothetical protein
MDINELSPMKPEGDDLFDRAVSILEQARANVEIRHIACGEFKASGKRHTQSGVLDAMALAVEQAGAERGFSPNLGRSHYRNLMNVENQSERLF